MKSVSETYEHCEYTTVNEMYDDIITTWSLGALIRYLR